MKRIPLLVTLLALGAVGGRADAKIGTIDNVPAATLLLPYFEVDLDNPNGPDTIFTIRNTSATAILTHVVLWSDWSVPTLAVNVYFTGYDEITIDLRDLFVKSRLPQTASAGQDPSDRISHHGPISQDINFGSCSGGLLPPSNFTIGRDHIRAAHTGKASPFNGLCYGEDHGDQIARGYVTIDTVNQCTGPMVFPGDVSDTSGMPYFLPGGSGVATNQNVLWGTFTLIERAEVASAQGALVAIEASATDPATSTPGMYTFYGRYDNWTAADNREPLPTNWATRFVNGAVFSEGTDFIIWRDPKVRQNPLICNRQPNWWPLGYEGITVFDEQEQPVGLIPDGFGGFKPVDRTQAVRNATNRTASGGPDFLTVFSFGWAYLNLNTTVAPAGAVPPVDPAAAQSWVFPIFRADGRFRVNFEAIQLDSGTAANHFNPGF
jgi:hypothetical protein